MTSKRKNVLAIAYACDPYRGSEEGVGWGWLNMLAQKHDVTCITELSYKESIERYQAETDTPLPIKFHYLEHQWNTSLGKFRRVVWIMHFVITYRKWQKEAYELGKKLQDQKPFDLCHLITYVAYRSPGEFYKLDCPFVWGPIGGLENTSWNAMKALDFHGMLYYGLRNTINSFERNFLRAPKIAFKNTQAIISATSGIQKGIRKYYKRDSLVLSEIGMSENPNHTFSKRGEAETLRISWSSNHDPGKALHLLLKGLAQLPSDINWQLDILGEGDSTKSWKSLSEKLGIQGNCIWHGKLARSSAMDVMANSHVFVVTSLKDLTSTVIVEAISLGLPVVALNHCGFTDVVTDGCGIKIDIARPDRISRDIKQAIELLYSNETHRRNLASGAIERSRHYLWSEKMKTIDDVYENTLRTG